MASLKEYWDYTEAERAAMTEQRVDELLSVELMAQGVVRPEPPKLETVERIELAKVLMYGIAYDGFRKLDVLFGSADDAAAFLALRPQIKGHDYQSDIHHAQQFVGTIESIEIFSEADAIARKRELVRNKERERANEKAQEEYNKASAIVTKTCERIWNDWREQRETLSAMTRVRQVFLQYVDTAGDEHIAMKFLRKAYADEKIRASQEWCGWSFPLHEATAAPLPAPALAPLSEVDF